MTHTTTPGVGQQPDRYPSAEYLLGALAEDRVPRDTAMKIARAYDDVRRSLDDEQMLRWFATMARRLGAGPSTMLAVLAYPSGHSADRYAELARTYGWKEDEDADDAQQV